MASERSTDRIEFLNTYSFMTEQPVFNVISDKAPAPMNLLVKLCTQNVIVYCGELTEVVPTSTDCRFIEQMVPDFIDRYFEECDENQPPINP